MQGALSNEASVRPPAWTPFYIVLSAVPQAHHCPEDHRRKRSAPALTGAIFSLSSQGSHRIEACGAARRDQTRRNGYERQERDDARQGEGIARICMHQERLQQPARRQGADDAKRESDGQVTQALGSHASFNIRSHLASDMLIQAPRAHLESSSSTRLQPCVRRLMNGALGGL